MRQLVFEFETLETARLEFVSVGLRKGQMQYLSLTDLMTLQVAAIFNDIFGNVIYVLFAQFL